ncbi:ankyrin repeat domain-containing protein 61-like [Notolabrus celidotus]|uniref:ankyrin repeat domain-containing protein 61-like n=1 Tax=Notolabrus celidotus TaxID=1203425 RepID=UPI00148FAF55|nr:ankyrin repeat domain-containing protein 61-like [Notolabrus celidotus]
MKLHNNEFYNAVKDEDLERMEGCSRKYGSNCLIQMQQRLPGEVLWKGFAVLPLHLAASNRRMKSMQFLLSAGADPEMRNQYGQTTLHMVIASWPNIFTGSPKPGSKFPTAVISARRQAEACLQLLCEHGVNVNAEVEGEGHQRALHLSVRFAAHSAVHILSSYGANVDAVDDSGMTPLHMAAGMLRKDHIVSLIQEGADVNTGVKHSENTPLHLAAMTVAMRTSKTLNDDIGCISALLEQGAEVNAENKAGMTPLQQACSMGNEELVDLMLRHGANINKLSTSGENCLFLFLNQRHNVQNNSLLVKLLSLISPLTVYDHNSLLPYTLSLPCFFRQRDQLLTLIQQPRRLQDICKCDIYLKYVQGNREGLREILPEKMYDFVFNNWENLNDISFEMDGEQHLFNDLFGMSPS